MVGKGLEIVFGVVKDKFGNFEESLLNIYCVE
jgi:hypothetical protein